MRPSGLMVSMFDSGSSGLSLSPGWGHYVVFFRVRTLFQAKNSKTFQGLCRTLL